MMNDTGQDDEAADHWCVDQGLVQADESVKVFEHASDENGLSEPKRFLQDEQAWAQSCR